MSNILSLRLWLCTSVEPILVQPVVWPAMSSELSEWIILIATGNQFGGQEPGSSEQIKAFAKNKGG